MFRIGRKYIIKKKKKKEKKKAQLIIRFYYVTRVAHAIQFRGIKYLRAKENKIQLPVLRNLRVPETSSNQVINLKENRIILELDEKV
jgi:hypothetical protein